MSNCKEKTIRLVCHASTKRDYTSYRIDYHIRASYEWWSCKEKHAFIIEYGIRLQTISARRNEHPQEAREHTYVWKSLWFFALFLYWKSLSFSSNENYGNYRGAPVASREQRVRLIPDPYPIPSPAGPRVRSRSGAIRGPYSSVKDCDWCIPTPTHTLL